MAERPLCAPPAQAQRLVKNSIIAVEAPDEDMAEEDYVEDEAEFEDVARRHRGAPPDSGAGPSPGNDDERRCAAPALPDCPAKFCAPDQVA